MKRNFVLLDINNGGAIMAREVFFDSLRSAHQFLTFPRASTSRVSGDDSRLAQRIDSADLWLTPKSVEGFNSSDFSDWPKRDRESLVEEVDAFLKIAKAIPPKSPASRAQSTQARKHLEAAIKIVGRHLQEEWRENIEKMETVATEAAIQKRWFVERDEQKVSESLLGEYDVPRVRIKTPDQEVLLVPRVRFGSGRQGVVDLLVYPTLETEYVVALKDGDWNIISMRGVQSKRPFNEKTFINTVTRLPRC